MAEWPDIEELKQVLALGDADGVWDGDEDNTRLTGVLLSAIEHVKHDVGEWADDDEPDIPLARAALRMAELMALRPEVTAQFAAEVGAGDPAYQQHMFGHRKRFGFA